MPNITTKYLPHTYLQDKYEATPITSNSVTRKGFKQEN